MGVCWNEILMTERPTNSPGSRLDPVAVVSLVAALCVPAVLEAGWLPGIENAGNAIQDALLWAVIAGAIATATGGLISYVRITRSSGSMQGVPLAIAAMVVSIVVVCFVAFVLFGRVVLGLENFH
jgi:CHASE2 domain-containing sensor protein